MSRRDVALNNAIENEDLCASCRYIADHWYEIEESGGSKGWKPYSIKELLLNAEGGCLLCRLIMDNSESTRNSLEKNIDLEQLVSFKVYGPPSKYEIVVSTLNHEFGPEIQLFESGRS
jgi:hypothetical protein